MRTAVLPSLAVVAAAACSGEPSVVAIVRPDPAIGAECVVVTVRDDSGHQASQPVPFETGATQVTVGIFRGPELDATIEVGAYVPREAGCALPATPRLAATAMPATFAFPADRVELDILPATPAALTFTASPPDVEQGRCSGDFVLAVQDALGRPAELEQALAVSLTGNPDLGLSWFSDPACATPAGTASFAPGRPPDALVLHAQGSQLGTARIVASAGSLAPAEASFTVRSGPSVSLVTLSSPATVLAGECGPELRLQLRDAQGNDTTTPTALSLTLDSSTPAGTAFYADADCTLPATSPQIPAGSGTASFRFRGYAPGPLTLTASSGALGPAEVTHTVQANIRSGQCALADGVVSVSCMVVPPLINQARAFLAFQISALNPDPANTMVRCRLASTGTVTCDRTSGTGVVEILWQTVELARMQVQQVVEDCPSGVTSFTVGIPRPVADVGQTFVLLSATGNGATFGDDDYWTAELVDADTVELRSSGVGSCSSGDRVAVQVVELPGSRVTRGKTGAMTTGDLAVTGLSSVTRARSFLLYSWTHPAGSTTRVCDRMVRGEIDSSTSLHFWRGMSTTPCSGAENVGEISWERVELTQGLVQHLDVTMGASVGVVTATIPVQVNLSRAIALSGGQWSGGQASGEGALTTDDAVGEALARIQIRTPAQIELRRSATGAPARWSPFVVEFQP